MELFKFYQIKDLASFSFFRMICKQETYTNAELFNQMQSGLIEISLIPIFKTTKRSGTMYMITELLLTEYI